MIQEQWFQLKNMFSRVITWNFLFSGGNWPLVGGKSTGGNFPRWEKVVNRFLAVWENSLDPPSRENPILWVQYCKRNNLYQQNCFNGFWNCWSKNISFSIVMASRIKNCGAHFCASKRYMCTVMLYLRLLCI